MTQYTVVAHGESTTVAVISLEESDLTGILKLLDVINANQGDAYEPSIWLWKGKPPASDQDAVDRDIWPVNQHHYYTSAWREVDGEKWLVETKIDSFGNRTDTKLWQSDVPAPAQKSLGPLTTSTYLGRVRFDQYAHSSFDAYCNLCTVRQDWVGQALVQHAISHGFEVGDQCVDCLADSIDSGFDTTLCSKHKEVEDAAHQD